MRIGAEIISRLIMSVRKVLFICSVYKPNFGGVEITIEKMAHHLKKVGVESVILTKRFPKELSEFETIDGISIYRIQRPVLDTEFESVISGILKNETELKADLVHIIGIRRPMPLIGFLLAKKWNVPYLVTFTGGDLPQSGNEESKKLWQEGLATVRDIIPLADDWTAFAEHTSSLASEIFKDIRKPGVIYGGINLELIRSTKAVVNKSPYFFTARRLEYSKGIDLLIEAFAKISPRLRDYELIIAGDGPKKNELERLAQSLSARIRFLGSVNQKTVFEYMKGATAHICPSRTESGGLVNYEAQAAGCIAIGSNVDGIPEYIINNKTGLLFETENIEDLSNKLLLASSNNLKIREIRERAMEESKKHGWEFFTNTYLNLYQSLIFDHRSNDSISKSKLASDLLQKINS